MEDAQSPPDAESPKAEQARRNSRKLGDAEAVATDRRDMLGDSSLLNTLSDSPLPPNHEEPDVADTPEPAVEPPSASQPPEGPGGPEGNGPGSAGPLAPADTSQPGQYLDLDAIIDSFPDEARSRSAEQAPPEPADPSFLAASRLALLSRGAEDADHPADQLPPAAPDRFQVSAIFAALGPAAPPAELAAAPLEPQADAEAGTVSSHDDGGILLPPEHPASALGLRVPISSHPLDVAMPDPSQWPPPPDFPGGAQESGQPDPLDPPGSRQGTPTAALDPTQWPPFPEANPDAGPDAAGAADRAHHPAFPEMPQFLEPPSWPAEAGSARAETPPPFARERTAAPFPEPAEWPPFPEPPGAEADHAQAAPLQQPPFLAEPSEAGDEASQAPPFPGPPAWPPFMDPPGAAFDRSAAGPAGLPPYIELPAHGESGEERGPDLPGFSEPPATAEVVPFPPRPEPFPRAPTSAGEAPPFPRSRGLPPMPPAAAPPSFDDWRAAAALPESGAEWSGRLSETEPEYGADRVSGEASAQIAAQADATAHALDNLQRLFGQQPVPPPPAAPPPQRPQAFHTQSQRGYDGYSDPQDEQPLYPPLELAPMPLPMAPPPEPASGKNVLLLGFLTGLVLSVVAGAALYFLITTG